MFGRHGRKVVVTLCGWEIVALTPGSPVVPITGVVRRYPVVGLVILGLLAHHWYVELVDEIVEDAAQTAVRRITSV